MEVNFRDIVTSKEQFYVIQLSAFDGYYTIDRFLFEKKQDVITLVAEEEKETVEDIEPWASLQKITIPVFLHITGDSLIYKKGNKVADKEVQSFMPVSDPGTLYHQVYKGDTESWATIVPRHYVDQIIGIFKENGLKITQVYLGVLGDYMLEALGEDEPFLRVKNSQLLFSNGALSDVVSIDENNVIHEKEVAFYVAEYFLSGKPSVEVLEPVLSEVREGFDLASKTQKVLNYGLSVLGVLLLISALVQYRAKQNNITHVSKAKLIESYSNKTDALKAQLNTDISFLVDESYFVSGKPSKVLDELGKHLPKSVKLSEVSYQKKPVDNKYLQLGVDVEHQSNILYVLGESSSLEGVNSYIKQLDEVKEFAEIVTDEIQFDNKYNHYDFNIKIHIAK